MTSNLLNSLEFSQQWNKTLMFSSRQQAKLMLSKTELAIADIALQVGFSSQSHLTQQFKRLTGMTPKQVR